MGNSQKYHWGNGCDVDVLRSSRKLHRLSASKRFTFSVSKCLRSWCIEYVAPLYPKAWLIFDKFSGNVLRNKSFISITFAVNENTLTLMRYSWYSHYQDICYTHKFGKICSTGRYFKRLKGKGSNASCHCCDWCIDCVLNSYISFHAQRLNNS